MSHTSTPRPLPLRHCLTVPAAVAEGTGRAAAPVHKPVETPPRLRAHLRHPEILRVDATAGAAVAAPAPVPSPGLAAPPAAAETSPVVESASAVDPPAPATAPPPAPVDVPPASFRPVAMPAPVPGVAYDLSPGETLSAVALAHGVRLEVLLAANGLVPSSILYIGERILVPTRIARVGRRLAASV